MTYTYETLVSLLQKFGARDAESWAQSEINEGIPQLMRFLLLRGMWKGVVAEDDTQWIQTHIAMTKQEPNGPLAGIGAALERLLAIGADPNDLIDVVRGMQYQLLFHIAYLLDNPMSTWDDVQRDVSELEEVCWGLWQEDSEGHPFRRIQALYESALDTDPTGREMRPRKI